MNAKRPSPIERAGARRHVRGRVLDVICVAATATTLLPLGAVLVMLLAKGIEGLSADVFTSLPPLPNATGGGFGNALLGTVIMVLIAGILAIPLGILGAITLHELVPNSMFANAVRFAVKVLSGIPSIIAGVLAFMIAVSTAGTPNAIAGGIALSVLMLPSVMLIAEESLKQVPEHLRRAAEALGATRTQATFLVTIPAAGSGVITGVVLGFARAIGETAPLLLTAQFAANLWPIDESPPYLHLMRETASMPVLIFNFSGQPFQNQVDLAWSAALMLVAMVLTLNIVGKAVALRGRRHQRN